MRFSVQPEQPTEIALGIKDDKPYINLIFEEN
jgi:hypothetical protein